MKESVLREKSYAFAIRIIRLSVYLQKEKQEYVLSKQMLRSGTSIGALVRESEYGQSKLDFIHKLSIALKEANETEYWLSLLSETDFIEKKIHASISADLTEVLRILIASIKTAKGK